MYNPLQTETFMRSEKYPWYEHFTEERMSYVDDDKNIIVHDSCVNMSQEDNSQYIPFIIERYYQGIDLMSMKLQIYFVNSQMGANISTPINVQYSDYRIQFGWLVDRNATYVPGMLTFEIQAIGTVIDNEGHEQDYVWKSRPNKQIRIETSLTGDLTFEADENWYTELVKVINDKTESAYNSAQSAYNSAQEAYDLMQSVNFSEKNIEALENSLKISEKNAKTSEAQAKLSETNAANSATLSKSWAVGGTSTRADEETNNAKYWSETTKGLLDAYKTEINKSVNDFSTGFTNQITGLETEVAKIKSAEETLTVNLTSEISRATGVEQTLQGNIDTVSANLISEISRAQQAESSLTTNVNTISNNLSTEVSRATQVENGLDSRLSVVEAQSANIATIDSKVQTINTTLSTKANTDDVNKALAAKADVTALNSAVTSINNNKADAEAVETLTTSVDTLNASVNTMNTVFNNKADKTYVDSALADKADVGHAHNYIQISDIEPANNETILWIDIGTNTLKYYDGSEWINVVG